MEAHMHNSKHETWHQLGYNVDNAEDTQIHWMQSQTYTHKSSREQMLSWKRERWCHKVWIWQSDIQTKQANTATNNSKINLPDLPKIGGKSNHGKF